MNHEQEIRTSEDWSKDPWWTEHKRAWEDDLLDELRADRGEESEEEREEFDRAVDSIAQGQGAQARATALQMYPEKVCERCRRGPKSEPPALLWQWDGHWLCAACDEWIFGGAKSA